jgi:Flp pilus assembly pilin Flp
MNNLQPVNLQDPAIKARSSSNLIGRKVVIGLLVTLIVVAMIAWFGFLGWGMLELLWTLVAWIKMLWAALV